MTGSLTAPFANTSSLSKGGRSFTYVPTPEVIERLNACLGYGGWSYEVVEAFHFPVDDPQYVVSRGRLSALGTVKEQYGGQTVNRNKQGVILDLADDYKGSSSDALKKCAAMIGVGLYLSLGRGPTPFSSEPDTQQSPDDSDRGVVPTSPAVAPSSGGGEVAAPMSPSPRDTPQSARLEMG